MEVLLVLVPFLMQPTSSFALVQTNLGLGLGLMVTNSEPPAHQHRHLVR